MFKRCNYPKGPPPDVAATALATAAAPLGNLPGGAPTFLAATAAHQPMPVMCEARSPGSTAAAAVLAAAAASAGPSMARRAPTPPLQCSEVMPPAGAAGDDEERQLFWGAVEGCMALFGGGFPPQQPAAFRQPPTHDANLAGSSSVHAVMQPQTTAGFPGMRVAAADGAENDGGQSINRAVTAPSPSSAEPRRLCPYHLVDPRAAYSRRCWAVPAPWCWPAARGCARRVQPVPRMQQRRLRHVQELPGQAQFGGPGCRKQACMSRTCSSPRVVDDEDEQPTDAPAALLRPPPWWEHRPSASPRARSMPRRPSSRG